MKGCIGCDDDGCIFQENFIVMGIIKNSNTSSTFINSGSMKSNSSTRRHFYYIVYLV